MSGAGTPPRHASTDGPPSHETQRTGDRPRGASASAVEQAIHQRGAGTIHTTPIPEKEMTPGGASHGVITTPRRHFLRNPLLTAAAPHLDSDGDRLSNREGSSEGGSGSPSDENEARTRVLVKIDKMKQQLVHINQLREQDLEEFYSMAKKVEDAGGSNNPQMARIKQHYDKRNKKHSADVEAVQKKLATYEQRLADIEGGFVDHSSRSANMISTVGQGIRRTGANFKEMTSTVIAAPLELAQKLKKSTFGSNEHLDHQPGVEHVGHSQFYSGASTSKSSGMLTLSIRPTASAPSSATKAKSATLPANMRGVPPLDLDALNSGYRPSTSRGGSIPGNAGASKRPEQLYNQTGGTGGDSTPESIPMEFPKFENGPVLPTPAEFGEETVHGMYKEVRAMRQFNTTMAAHMSALQENVNERVLRAEKAVMEERFKYQRLEESLNEFIELHQAETAALKQELQLIASRIDYQYNDRFKRVEENLESTQNHMFRVENSLKASLDVQHGGPWYNGLLLSGATILVELLKIFLYLTAVVLDFFRPFTGTRTKAGALLLVMGLTFFTIQYVPSIIALFSASATDSSPSTSSSVPSNTTNTTMPSTDKAPDPSSHAGL